MDDPEYFLKAQDKFFLSFLCTLFYIFLTPKIYLEPLKSLLGRSILHYYDKVRRFYCLDTFLFLRFSNYLNVFSLIVTSIMTLCIPQLS